MNTIIKIALVVVCALIVLLLVALRMFGSQLSLPLLTAVIVFGTPFVAIGVATFLLLRHLARKQRNWRNDVVAGCVSAIPVFVVVVMLKWGGDGQFWSADLRDSAPIVDLLLMILIGGATAGVYSFLERKTVHA